MATMQQLENQLITKTLARIFLVRGTTQKDPRLIQRTLTEDVLSQDYSLQEA
ncbi:hypothetical protein D3C78_1826030 [compost metagenome]